MWLQRDVLQTHSASRDHCANRLCRVLKVTVIKREGDISFNDALNTFYLQLYGVIHMVKDHSDSERRHPLLPLLSD